MEIPALVFEVGKELDTTGRFMVLSKKKRSDTFVLIWYSAEVLKVIIRWPAVGVFIPSTILL